MKFAIGIALFFLIPLALKGEEKIRIEKRPKKLFTVPKPITAVKWVSVSSDHLDAAGGTIQLIVRVTSAGAPTRLAYKFEGPNGPIAKEISVETATSVATDDWEIRKTFTLSAESAPGVYTFHGIRAGGERSLSLEFGTRDQPAASVTKY